MSTVSIHQPGQPLPTLKAGDFILTHRPGFFSWAIRVGQALRFRGDRKVFARWSHAALVVSPTVIAEALSQGVVLSRIDKYHGVEFAVIHLKHSTEDTAQMMDFAAAVVGERTRYGYWEIASLALALMCPIKVRFATVGTAVCSGFVAQALTRSWAIFPEDPSFIEPAGLAEWADVQP